MLTEPSNAESYDAVLGVLRGKRLAFDAATWKMLDFILNDSAGCDVEITPSSFTLAWSRNKTHSYYLWSAPGVVSFLLDGTEFPATRRLVRQLGPTTVPGGERFPERTFEQRYVRIEALIARLVIRVRASEAALDAELPEIPARDDAPRFAHACPHCARVPERYRVLSDGGLVCLACGRSSAAPQP